MKDTDRLRFFNAALFACITGCAVRRPDRTPEALAAHREEVVRDVIEGRERLSRKPIARMITSRETAVPDPESPEIEETRP